MLFEGWPRGWVRLSPDGHLLAWVEADRGASNAWVAPADDLASARVVSPFLAKHLGGRAQPFATDLDDADLTVLTGAEHVPGLAPIEKARRARRPALR